jgi:amino-acid N-acetyltransferase
MPISTATIQTVTTSTIAIAPVAAGQFPQVLDLLARCGLPIIGLEEHQATTLVALHHGLVVGSGALELYGAAALLRSAAVDPDRRNQGIGRLLTEHLFALAYAHGVQRLYLLTETAADYFARRGFQPIPRSEVEAAVQQSVEFTFACPQSAQAMRFELAPRTV